MKAILAAEYVLVEVLYRAYLQCCPDLHKRCSFVVLQDGLVVMVRTSDL